MENKALIELYAFEVYETYNSYLKEGVEAVELIYKREILECESTLYIFTDREEAEDAYLEIKKGRI
jgi:hypothetical protein